jgi:hypothetical protein
MVIDFCEWSFAMLLPEPTGALGIFEIKCFSPVTRFSAELEILRVEEEVFVIVTNDELFPTGLQDFLIPPDCFLKFVSAIKAMFHSCVAPRLREMLHTAIVPCGGQFNCSFLGNDFIADKDRHSFVLAISARLVAGDRTEIEGAMFTQTGCILSSCE